MPTNSIQKSLGAARAAAKATAQNTTPKTKSSVQAEYSYANTKEFSTGLDSESFMKLMIAQIKNQDPMSPMDNSQFMMQTAMMTMVEKVTNIELLMKESNSSLLNVKEYEEIIGKKATYEVARKDDSGQVYVTTASGTVDGVKMVDGRIWFIVGKDIISQQQIHGLESLTSQTGVDQTLKYANMIGYKVTYTEQGTGEDGKPTSTESTGIIQAVSMKNGLVEFVLADGKKIKSTDIVGLEVVKPEEEEKAPTEPDGSEGTDESGGTGGSEGTGESGGTDGSEGTGESENPDSQTPDDKEKSEGNTDKPSA
ncbi:flagellar hook capping family protein [Brevibacillus laterosporus]|uniref:flagellar hook assembly protein FlgD n=1 Tax=Brevibacillus laterosporus TaxID=1465 RepID=UPI000BC5AA3D|nr:flagellar hook capping FlgD N-terminal domain-containing protein [Brevibacillus laterosporus]PCN45491.1 flagellar hook capping family protein [Brevibacillus laterosporus]